VPHTIGGRLTLRYTEEEENRSQTTRESIRSLVENNWRKKGKLGHNNLAKKGRSKHEGARIRKA